MQASKKYKNYHWIIVLAGALVVGAGVGILVSCNGLFIKPVTEELGFSRGGFTLYATIQSMVAMVMSPVFGRFFKKFPIKRVIFSAGAYCCVLFFLFSYATELWHFYLLGALYGIGYSGTTNMAAGTLVNRWFKEKKGVATGLSYCGAGLSSTIMIIVTSNVIENLGWQWGYRIQAIVALVLFSLAAILIKDSPESIGLLPYGAKPEADGVTVRETTGLYAKEAAKTPVFYLMAFSIFFIVLIGMGINPHIAAALTDLGYDATFASSILSGVMFLTIFSKALLGVFVDKVGPTKSGLTIGALLCSSALLLTFSGLSPIMPWIFVVVFGIGYASLSVPFPILTSAIFGDRDFPTIFSIYVMGVSAGSGLGSVLSGFMYDITGSYTSIFMFYAALSVVVALMLTYCAKVSKTNGYAASETGFLG